MMELTYRGAHLRTGSDDARRKMFLSHCAALGANIQLLRRLIPDQGVLLDGAEQALGEARRSFDDLPMCGEALRQVKSAIHALWDGVPARSSATSIIFALDNRCRAAQGLVIEWMREGGK